MKFINYPLLTFQNLKPLKYESLKLFHLSTLAIYMNVVKSNLLQLNCRKIHPNIHNLWSLLGNEKIHRVSSHLYLVKQSITFMRHEMVTICKHLKIQLFFSSIINNYHTNEYLGNTFLLLHESCVSLGNHLMSHLSNFILRIS